MNECEDCDRLDCRERGCIAPVTMKERNMKIKINKPVEVEPAVMQVHLKIRDEFSFTLVDTNSNVIAEQDEGYVPNFFPGQYGDYVDLHIDVRTGKITNWGEHFTAERLQLWMDKKDE